MTVLAVPVGVTVSGVVCIINVAQGGIAPARPGTASVAARAEAAAAIPDRRAVVTQGYLTATAAWRGRSRCAEYGQAAAAAVARGGKALRCFVALMMIFFMDCTKSYLIRRSGKRGL